MLAQPELQVLVVLVEEVHRQKAGVVSVCMVKVQMEQLAVVVVRVVRTAKRVQHKLVVCMVEAVEVV
jgi:hypothetical protein